MTSTLENVRGAEEEPRSVTGRRIGTILLALFLLAGLLGFLGDRVVTRTAEQDGYTLTLTYPASARPGLDEPWKLDITSETGFGEEIVVAVTGSYFSIYEHQDLSPAPTETTSDGTFLYWTFAAPDGNTFSASMDQYVQPSSQVGDSGVVALVVEDAQVAPVEFSTVLWP